MSRFYAWLLGRTWWIRKWVVLLRERQLRVHAAAELVAGELESHAEIIRATGTQYSTSFSFPTIEFHFDAWHKHRADLYSISKKDSDLWHDVQAMYAALQQRATRGGVPPTPEEVENLARRLRTTRY